MQEPEKAVLVVEGTLKMNKMPFQRWRSLRIPVKFGFAYGLLLLIILTQTVIAYTALTILWEANHSIQSGVEVQRLVMGMSRNWETARRLQNIFFFRSPSLGTDQTYELYALPASGKIAEVVRDGATLRRLLSSTGEYEHLREHNPGISKILSTVSQYATTLEESTNLELQLASKEIGLLSQLDSTAARLLVTFQAYDHCDGLLSTYYEMRLFEKDYQLTAKSTSSADVFDAAAHLRQIIETCPVQAGQQASVLSSLDEYENLANSIFSLDGQIRKNLNQLDELGNSIDPNLISLLVAVESEVKSANLQIEQTRQMAVTMLTTAAIIGLLSTAAIAGILHRSVTQNIVILTQVASQFQKGNLDVRACVNSSDELGDLASTFNDMADTLARRLTQIENLHAQLHEQAIRDALTGLYNRRFLDETLSKEFDQASRNGAYISVVMIDIDHFKEVNDHYGHAKGDQILAELGKVLRDRSRGGDIACRYGGDEFVVVLVGTQLKDAVQCAEIWKRRFRDIAVLEYDATVGSTLSIGIVQWRPGESASELLIRADEALYRAKKTGRDRIATQG